MKSTRTPIRTDIGKSIENVSSETLSFYKIDTGLADAGEAAGTVVAGVLAKSPILTKLGDREGTYDPADKFATSIAFTTGVMDSTKEIGFIFDADGNQRILQTKALLDAQTGNGWWACDYFSGLILVKKATTGTSQVITSYKARAGSTTGTGTLATQIQGTAAADAAAVGNPVQVGGLYVSADPNLTSGDIYPLKHDSKGNLMVSKATLDAGENLTRNVMITSFSNASSRITTNTTTVCKSGAGSLVGIWVEVATTGIITVYDNTAASGTVLLTIPAALPVGEHVFPIACSLGITVVTAAADRIAVSVQ